MSCYFHCMDLTIVRDFKKTPTIVSVSNLQGYQRTFLQIMWFDHILEADVGNTHNTKIYSCFHAT